MNYLVIDTETNIKNVGVVAVGRMKADPFQHDNHIVWWGTKRPGFKKVDTWKSSTFHVPKNTKLLVGQNIKFDLLYMWKDNPTTHAAMYDQEVTIWCTQLAEYLLTGQDTKWASLDQLSKKYGGTLKDDRMKEYWDNGVDTEDIPDSELKPYLEYDVLNTERVFLAQVRAAHEMGMLPLLMSQMEALLATAEMEFNGMQFDTSLARGKAGVALHLADKLQVDLQAEMVCSDMINANCGSNRQMSTFLFGGEYTYTEKVYMLTASGDVILYKSGKNKGEPRLKNQTTTVTVKGKIKPNPDWKIKEGWAVNNDVLTEIYRAFEGNKDTLAVFIMKFIDRLRKYRALTKDAKTYYIGYAALCWPDSKIHGHFNHTNTNTGRLSSSSPNLQNVTTQE